MPKKLVILEDGTGSGVNPETIITQVKDSNNNDLFVETDGVISLTNGHSIAGSALLDGSVDYNKIADAIIPNPTLSGVEQKLTGIQFGDTKYKVTGGGGGSDVIANEPLTGDEPALKSLTIDGVRYKVEGGSGTIELPSTYFDGDTMYTSDAIIYDSTLFVTPNVYNDMLLLAGRTRVEEEVLYVDGVVDNEILYVTPTSGNAELFVGEDNNVSAEELFLFNGVVEGDTVYVTPTVDEDTGVLYLDKGSCTEEASSEVIANPVLTGDEETLVGIQVGGKKYKVAGGGGSGEMDITADEIAALFDDICDIDAEVEEDILDLENVDFEGDDTSILVFNTDNVSVTEGILNID